MRWQFYGSNTYVNIYQIVHFNTQFMSITPQFKKYIYIYFSQKEIESIITVALK